MALVSIVVPVHLSESSPRAAYFPEALESVRKQTSPDWICLVVDDGSKTNYAEAVVADIQDSRIRYVRRERSSSDLETSSNALNFGLSLLLNKSQDILAENEATNLTAACYLHSDDLLPKTSIEKRMRAIQEGYKFVYGSMAFYDDNMGKFVSGWSREKINLSSKFSPLVFPHHTTMWEIGFLSALSGYVKAVYGREGIFDPQLGAFEDQDASASAIEVVNQMKSKVSRINGITYVYRCHDDSISGGLREELDVIKGYHQRVKQKHFSQSSKGLILASMTADLPWSLALPLPESIKRKLRPIKRTIKSFIPSGNLTLEAIMEGN